MTNAPFFNVYFTLKETLAQHKPISEKWVIIEPLLKDDDIRREFWNAVDSPEWLPYLTKSGLFNDDLNSEAFAWAPTKFLARVALKNPKAVITAIHEIKRPTLSMLDAFLKMACELSTNDALELLPWLVENTAGVWLGLAYTHASELCCKLARSGADEAAWDLVKVVFVPPSVLNHLEQRGDQPWFIDGCTETLKCLVGYKPVEVVAAVSELLSIEVAKSAGDNGDDYSSIWRERIEEGVPHRSDVKNLLVSLVRQLAEQALTAHRVHLAPVLKIWEQKPWSIFVRLTLHAVSEFGALAEVGPLLMNREYFEDYRLRHEYGQLVHAWFAKLPVEEKSRWLSWIAKGPPDLNTSKYSDRDVAWWELPRLHWVRGELPEQMLVQYKSLREKYGDPDELYQLRHTSSWGVESPIPIEELRTLSFPVALYRVNSWKSDGTTMHPRSALEGLASAFGEYIAQNFAAAAESAESLKGAQPVFVRTYLERITAAVRNGGGVTPIEPTLRLCNWIIEQGTGGEQQSPWSEEVTWSWTRDAIASLVDHICGAREGDRPRYPISLRKSLWHLIKELVAAPAKSYIVGDLEAWDLRVEDLLNYGINSPRGKVIHAALEYGRWVAVSTNPASLKMSAMAELGELLDGQIASGNRTPEVLSVIGSRINLLYWIDKDWLRERTDQLFHLEQIESDPGRAFGWAAWSAFLVWVPPHREFYAIFQKQFDYAIQHAGLVNSLGTDSRGPMQHLGKHLAILYGRGDLGELAETNLVQRFLSVAIAPLRASTVRFIGVSLSEDRRIEPPLALPEPVVTRFKSLWDWYWPKYGELDVKTKNGDPEFGWWFTSSHFPMPWALANLHVYLVAGGSPEPDYAILENLTKAINNDLPIAVAVLKQVIFRRDEPWRLHSAMESVSRVLGVAMKHSEAKGLATEVIDQLGRQGYLQFGSLLEQDAA